MIDREGRDAAATILEGYRSRRMSNSAFEKFPRSRDPALRAIQKKVWFIYDDRVEHFCDGTHALNSYWVNVVDRCVLFLHSDLEYEWRMPFMYSGYLERYMANSHGMAATHLRRLWHWGDYSVWPFFRGQDYDRALEASLAHRAIGTSES